MRCQLDHVPVGAVENVRVVRVDAVENVRVVRLGVLPEGVLVLRCEFRKPIGDVVDRLFRALRVEPEVGVAGSVLSDTRFVAVETRRERFEFDTLTDVDEFGIDVVVFEGLNRAVGPWLEVRADVNERVRVDDISRDPSVRFPAVAVQSVGTRVLTVSASRGRPFEQASKLKNDATATGPSAPLALSQLAVATSNATAPAGKAGRFDQVHSHLDRLETLAAEYPDTRREVHERLTKFPCVACYRERV